MRKTEKPEVKISVTTSVDTTTWAFGKQVLEIFCNVDARLMPERVGGCEPVKTPVENVAACEQHWAPDATIDGPYGRSFVKRDFLWKRTKAIKSDGHMMHTARNKLGNLKLGWLTFGAAPDKKTEWDRLFSRLCVAMQPKFATLHLFTDIEARANAFSAESDANFGTNDFFYGVPGHALENRGLANLAWATFFGEELAVEVDVQKLRDNGFRVEAIGKGFLVTLTSKLFDVMDEFAVFSTRRVVAKQLFKPGLFRIAEEPKFEAFK